VPTHRQPGGTPREAVRELLSSALDRIGLLIEDVTISPAGNRRVLRVLVDAADATAPALSLDDVADASRTVSALLDESDVMGRSPYVLEVSTPGVDRALTQPRHFARNVGRLVRVTSRDGDTVEGRIASAADALVLEVPGAAQGTTEGRVIDWPDVARGQVQVEFNRSHEGS
jgi:ribosome maturation factor RimP